ncbi:MAG TPA: anthranilate synthase component I [Patescibacteria group bacterium]|nr:anthranilate synthase component I [Patescibacteria group bacterium]
MDRTSFARVRALSGRGNVIPICREIPADCLTPVMAFLAASKKSRRCFLLESVEGGERIARYSFLGRDPYRVLTVRGRMLEERIGRRSSRGAGEFLERLRALFHEMHPVPDPDLPRFTGGAVGYIGYDAVRIFEDLPAVGRSDHPGGPVLPDAWFGFHDTILAFDHLRQSLLLMTSIMTQRDGSSLKKQHAAALARLDRLASDLARRLPRPSSVARGRRGGSVGGAVSTRSSLTRKKWFALVRTAQEHIRAGDIYQVVLSRRFRRRLDTDPFSVYRALRRINPSPYMYFLRDGETALAGASPEMLVRVEGRNVEVHPIAGTRPRGRDAEEDSRLEAELVADAKERAEHVMLVDLGRNDLGRVCAPGAVDVPEFMKVQKFSHVMHLVSRVTGSLADGRDAFDALKSVFPAGTVSGAPKLRAMEIIDELEMARRGPYAGAVCYIDYSGNLDSCIVIRTMVASGRTAWVQAGAGIVADSDPGREYTETVNKARAVLCAIEGARRWAP